MHRGHARFALFALACGALTCEGVERPTPPDLTGLLDAYASPGGTLTQGEVERVRAELEDALDDIDEIDAANEVLELLTSVNDEEPAGRPEAEGQGEVELDDERTITIEGEGFVEVERTCDGWSDPPVAAPDNGRLDLFINVSDISVDPVVWVEARDCRYLDEGDRVFVSAGSRRDVGDLRIFVGDNLTLNDLGTAPVLVDVDVTAAVNDETPARYDYDFRLFPDSGDIETRLEVADGDLFVRASAERDILVVRARNGTFICVDTRCENEDGELVLF